MLLSKAVTATLSRGRTTKEWKSVFWPEHYAKAKHDMTVAGNTLSKEELLQLAKKMTQYRKIQRERASAVANDDCVDQDAYLRSAKVLASKMHLGYFR